MAWTANKIVENYVINNSNDPIESYVIVLFGKNCEISNELTACGFDALG